MSEIASPHWMGRWIEALHAYAAYQPSPSIICSFVGGKIGLIASGLILVGLIAGLWLRRESELLFQVALSVAIVYVLLPEEAYSAPILMIPAIWVVDHAKKIGAPGQGSQLAVAAVRVALVELWLASIAAAILLHTNPQGKAMAWWLPVNAVFPLLASLLAVLLLQAFRSSVTLEAQDSLHELSIKQHAAASSQGLRIS
jgi:hypothetical protein